MSPLKFVEARSHILNIATLLPAWEMLRQPACRRRVIDTGSYCPDLLHMVRLTRRPVKFNVGGAALMGAGRLRAEKSGLLQGRLPHVRGYKVSRC